MNILKDKFKKFYRKGRTDKEKLKKKKINGKASGCSQKRAETWETLQTLRQMICQEYARNVAQNKTNSTMKFLFCLLILFSVSVYLILFKHLLSYWVGVCHFYVPVIERNREGKEEKGINTMKLGR